MTGLSVELSTNEVSADGVSFRVRPKIAETIAAFLMADGYLNLNALHSKLCGNINEPMADQTLYVHVSMANKVLQTLGWRLENARALGWRLTQDEATRPPVPYARFAAVLAERDAALARLAGMVSP